MNEYRYYLTSKNPITGRTEKFICPECGQKRLVRYWDRWANDWAQSGGKCDRENNCAYWEKPQGRPADFWKEYQKQARILKPQPPKKAEIKPLNAVFNLWRDKYPTHHLKTFLRLYFAPSMVDEVLKSYLVTGDGGGASCFWQCNGKGAVTTCRIVKYKPDGHRDKEAGQNWAHSICEKAGLLPEGYQPAKYLFGLQLCRRGAKVLIVESEKTAVLCELWNRTHPHNDLTGKYNVFLATGGANFLKATMESSGQLLAALGCSVTLCPDDDKAGEGWHDVAKAHRWGLDLTASKTAPEGGGGWDLGDTIAARMVSK